jgi:hypothetical protein
MKNKNTNTLVIKRRENRARLELVKIARQTKTDRFLRLSGSI